MSDQAPPTRGRYVRDFPPHNAQPQDADGIVVDRAGVAKEQSTARVPAARFKDWIESIVSAAGSQIVAALGRLSGNARLPASSIRDLPSGGGGEVADGSITTPKLADEAVTTAKLDDDAVIGRKLAGNSVASGHIVDNAVTSSEIASNQVLTRHIAADQVTRGELAANSVGTSELVDGQVTAIKLAPDVRQLPAFPAAGSRDNKVPKFDGNTLGWEVDSGAAGGSTDQTARDRIANASARIDQLDRKASDLNILSEGPGFVNAPADEAGLAVFAAGTTIGDGLISGNRDIMAADLSGYSWVQATTLGATTQAIIMRVEGTLSGIDYYLRHDDVEEAAHDHRKQLSDSTWDYYYMGTASSTSISADKRGTVGHTAYEGELRGRALEQVEESHDEQANRWETVQFAPNVVTDRMLDGELTFQVTAHLSTEFTPAGATHFRPFVGRARGSSVAVSMISDRSRPHRSWIKPTASEISLDFASALRESNRSLRRIAAGIEYLDKDGASLGMPPQAQLWLGVALESEWVRRQTINASLPETTPGSGVAVVQIFIRSGKVVDLLAERSFRVDISDTAATEGMELTLRVTQDSTGWA